MSTPVLLDAPLFVPPTVGREIGQRPNSDPDSVTSWLRSATATGPALPWVATAGLVCRILTTLKRATVLFSSTAWYNAARATDRRVPASKRLKGCGVRSPTV